MNNKQLHLLSDLILNVLIVLIYNNHKNKNNFKNSNYNIYNNVNHNPKYKHKNK